MRTFKAIAITIVLAAPTFAHAFTLAADIVGGWAKPELAFKVNEASCTALGISASQLNTAIDAAVDLWNAVPTSSLRIKRGATTTSAVISDPPTIFCATTLSGSPDLDFVLAQGFFATTSVAKFPVLGLIEINGDSTKDGYFGNLTADQSAITIAHEMGHVLGLGHSESATALMYYDISAKKHLKLSQDDIDGMTWLNPRDEPMHGLMGCGTVSVLGSNGGGGPGGSGPSVILTWLALVGIAYGVTRPQFFSQKKRLPLY